MATTLVKNNSGHEWTIPNSYGGGCLAFGDTVAVASDLAAVQAAFNAISKVTGKLEFTIARDADYPNAIQQLKQLFVSAELTGTGAQQTVAHGLGVVPTNVVITPTDMSPAPVGVFTVTEGVHDNVNVKVSVTLNKKYKIHAAP